MHNFIQSELAKYETSELITMTFMCLFGLIAPLCTPLFNPWLRKKHPFEYTDGDYNVQQNSLRNPRGN